MLILGVVCLIVAIVLIALGVINTAVSALIWVGIGLVVVAVVLYLLSRRGTGTPV
jgi:hypothetical protein